MGQETPASVYSIPASRVSKGNLTGMRAVGRVELGSLTASSWQVSIWMFFRSLCAHLSCSRLLCTQALKLNTSGLPLFSVQPAQRLIPLSNGNKNPPHLNTDLSNDQPGQIIWASRHSGQPHTKTIDPQQNTFLFIWRMEFGRILNLNPKCKGFRSQPVQVLKYSVLWTYFGWLILIISFQSEHLYHLFHFTRHNMSVLWNVSESLIFDYSRLRKTFSMMFWEFWTQLYLFSQYLPN